MAKSAARQFEELKENVEELKSEKERLKGGMEELMKRLKDEFGFSTIQEAEKALSKLDLDIEKQEKKFQKDLDNFEEEWEEELS